MAKWLNGGWLFLIILLDQSSKWCVVKLGWPIFYNQRWLFGLLGDSVWLQGVVYCLLLGLIVYWKRRETMASLTKLGLLLIIGGGMSNQIDKIWRGEVIDFIDIKILPVFNLADVLITLGAILIVYHYFYVKTKNYLPR